MMTNSIPNYKEPIDVFIAGAGMSGLFAAYRLLKSNNKLKIVVVDKLGRTGGRLETTTVKIKGNDGKAVLVKDEEGGMRFVPIVKKAKDGTTPVQGMQNLWKLIHGFKLPTAPFVMGDENNRLYYRGFSFTRAVADATQNGIWSKLYNLAPAEKNLSPVTILANAMQAILDQNSPKPGTYKAGSWPDTPETWKKFRNTFTFEDQAGKPVVINQWGFWSLLSTQGYSEECITMLSQAIGFMGPLEAFINAGESLQIIFDFPSAVAFDTLVDGYEKLPDTLEDHIKKMGGVIILNEEILSLESNGKSAVVTGSKFIYKAEKIILAVPKSGLKKITQNSPGLLKNKAFVKAISSVKNMELSKVGLYFTERWWHSNKAINLTNGPSFTDLPLGSVYCFSQFPLDNEKDAKYNGPAALTLYTDFIRGNFWKEMQNFKEKYKPIDLVQPANTSPASKNLVHELMRQIKMVFGLDPDDKTVPMPVLSTYRVWGEGEFGYGYHQYKLNVNDIKDVYEQISNPIKNVFVCNEAWSPEQGWVEGSLIMTDSILVKGFHLKPFVLNEK